MAKEQHVLLINGARLSNVIQNPDLLPDMLDNLLSVIDPAAMAKARNDVKSSVLLNSHETCERYGITWDHLVKYFMPHDMPFDKTGRYYWFSRSKLNDWEFSQICLTWKIRNTNKYYDLRRHKFVSAEDYEILMAEYEKLHEAEIKARQEALYRDNLSSVLQSNNHITKVSVPVSMSEQHVNSMQRLMALQKKRMI